MPSAKPRTRDFAPDDELDAILNGEIEIGDISATNNALPNQNTQEQQKRTEALGLDKAIEVDQVKQRLPVPKLDDARLLSAAGIPKLRRISKERLRFKGKGHEYGDIARMLNMYQLWLDDMYPRAKFADGLAIIEKLGHSKRIQYMRKEWIAEGKPKIGESDPEEIDVVAAEITGEQDPEHMEGIEVEKTGRGDEPRILEENGVLPQKIPDSNRAMEEDPDEDELDTLLRESDAPGTSFASTVLRPKPAAPEEDDNFEDDEDAMAELGGMW